MKTRGCQRKLGQQYASRIVGLSHHPLESTIGEIRFLLTYGVEAVIIMEIEEVNRRTKNPLPPKSNNKAFREEVDLLEERGIKISFTNIVVKYNMNSMYNLRV